MSQHCLCTSTNATGVNEVGGLLRMESLRVQHFHLKIFLVVQFLVLQKQKNAITKINALLAIHNLVDTIILLFYKNTFT